MHTYDSGSGPLEGNYPEPVYIPVEVPEAPEPAGHGESTATDIPVAAALSPVHEYDGGPADGPRGSILNEENRDLWPTPDNTEDGGPAPVSPAPAAPEDRDTPLWGPLPVGAAVVGEAAGPGEALPAAAASDPEPVSAAAAPSFVATPAAAAGPSDRPGESGRPEADERFAVRPPRRPVLAPDPADRTPAEPESAPSSAAARAAAAAGKVGRILITGPASIGASWAIHRAKLAENTKETFDRLPPWVRGAIRAMDLGAVACFAVGAYRVVTTNMAMRDPSQATAGLPFLRDEVNSFLVDAGIYAAQADSPDMVPASHVTNLETPAGPDFGYDDMSRQALETDPGTGRASNVSDWSKQSYAYWLKEHGASDEQIAQFFNDNPNAIDNANKAFFEGNPTVNPNDGFGGGLNANDTYDTAGQNNHAWSEAEQWANANGITTTEPDKLPPTGGGDSGNGNDGQNKEPGQPGNGTSAAPGSPAPAEPGDQPSSAQPAQPTVDPTPTPDGSHDQQDAQGGDKHDGSKSDDGKPSVADRFIVPPVLSIAIPSIAAGMGYYLGNEAAKRAQDDGIGSYHRPSDEDDDDD